MIRPEIELRSPWPLAITNHHANVYIYIHPVSQRPKTVGVDYSCIEYMRNII